MSQRRTSGKWKYEREVEVLASGLPLQHGSQLAVDVTLRCALTACGRARPNGAIVDGTVTDGKEKFSELVDGPEVSLGGCGHQDKRVLERLATSWKVSLGHVPRRHLMSCDILLFLAWRGDGPECLPFLVAGHSLDLSHRHAATSQEWMEPHLIWLTSSGRGEV